MPVVIFFACLDLEQKSLFLNGDYNRDGDKVLAGVFEPGAVFFEMIAGKRAVAGADAHAKTRRSKKISLRTLRLCVRQCFLRIMV